MNIDKYVDKYIELRDLKAKIENEAKVKTAKVKEAMDLIESKILKFFEESGQESSRTKSGTVYKNTRTSATVADWDAVLNFIRDNEAYDMLDRRVNKKAVEEYKEENGELPPGVNWRAEVVIGVNRPKK